jgi:hypothetical protein
MASTCTSLSGYLSLIISFDNSNIATLLPKSRQQLSISLKTSAGSFPAFSASAWMSWMMASPSSPSSARSSQ